MTCKDVIGKHALQSSKPTLHISGRTRTLGGRTTGDWVGFAPGGCGRRPDVLRGASAARVAFAFVEVSYVFMYCLLSVFVLSKEA